MRTLVIVAFLFSSIVVFAHREKSYFLAGTVGEDSVAMRIDEYGDQCFMSYYQVKSQETHILNGQIFKNNSFKLHTFVWDSVKNQRVAIDTVKMIEVENFLWEGTFYQQNGEVDKIHLAPINIDSLHHPYAEGIKKYPNMRLDAFAAFRTQKVNFVDDSNVKKRKTPTIKWVKDGRSGLRYIRVVPDKKNKVNVDSINLFLATEHLKLIESKEDCSNGNDKGVYENEVEVHFLNERFLSYSLTIHSACLGARLQSITTHHTFDITTGKEYKLEDLYWFGDEEKPEIRHGGQEWYQYRYKVFGSKILSLLMESHPEIFESLQEDCPNITEKYWRFPDWYLTTEGLYLVGKNTFKNKDCMVETQWSVLPWDTIESFYVGPKKQVK